MACKEALRERAEFLVATELLLDAAIAQHNGGESMEEWAKKLDVDTLQRVWGTTIVMEQYEKALTPAIRAISAKDHLVAVTDALLNIANRSANDRQEATV